MQQGKCSTLFLGKITVFSNFISPTGPVGVSTKGGHRHVLRGHDDLLPDLVHLPLHLGDQRGLQLPQHCPLGTLARRVADYFWWFPRGLLVATHEHPGGCQGMRTLLMSWWTSSSQCWGSVTFWCGSGSPDPYLWLIDPDPTSEPTLSSLTLRMQKKYFSQIFLFFNLPTGTSSSVEKCFILAKILC